MAQRWLFPARGGYTAADFTRCFFASIPAPACAGAAA